MRKLEIDTTTQTIKIEGKEFSLQFLDWFFNQPEGTVIRFGGLNKDGHQIFTSYDPRTYDFVVE